MEGILKGEEHPSTLHTYSQHNETHQILFEKAGRGEWEHNGG
jgi:hypothetical protein